MNLINTSKHKNHFILKKSQRTVEVVLTLFYFVNTYLATNQNQNENKYKYIKTKRNPGKDNILSVYFTILAKYPERILSFPR